MKVTTKTVTCPLNYSSFKKFSKFSNQQLKILNYGKYI